jgi:hypothetical protein
MPFSCRSKPRLLGQRIDLGLDRSALVIGRTFFETLPKDQQARVYPSPAIDDVFAHEGENTALGASLRLR